MNNKVLLAYVKGVMYSAPRPKDVIWMAWKKSQLSQIEFARKLGKSQPMVSKYISGDASPPAEVVILCMNMSGLLGAQEISAHLLAKRITTELAGSEHSAVRSAISELLNSISMHSSSPT